MTSIALLNTIVRETEKAIQINTGDRLVWVPKSVICLEGDVVMCKNWFAKKNAIGVYGYRPCVIA